MQFIDYALRLNYCRQINIYMSTDKQTHMSIIKYHRIIIV